MDLTYEKVAATANELDRVILSLARQQGSAGFDVAHGGYLAGLLQGLLIAGQPINSTTLHQRWLEAARMVARLRQQQVAA